MNTRFLYQGIDVDERTKEYVLKRLERVEKLVSPLAHYEVEIDGERRGFFRVEIMVRDRDLLYRAEERTESVEGSVDLIIDELETQILRRRDRERDLELRGERSIKKGLVVDEAARL